MEIIAVILILVFLFANANDKKKKAKRKALLQGKEFLEASGAERFLREVPTAQPAAQEKPVSKQKAASAAARARVAEERREALARLRSAAQAKLRELEAVPGNGAAQAAALAVQAAVPARAQVRQGASLLDEEGCVGGSMDHDHAEGEGRAEHARHIDAVKRREAAELLERAEADNRAENRVRRLREAVVMAEVLNRPVALRPRGIGRRAG